MKMKNGLNKMSRGWLPVVAILALSGCSDIGLGGLFGDDAPAPQTASEQNLRDRADTEQANAENSDTPSLTSVPNRSAAGSTANRNRVVEGLISDRDNARYTDEAIRLQGSTRPAAASQAAAAPAPAAATPAPATAQVAVTPPPAPAAPSTQIVTPPPPVPIARTEPSAATTQSAQTQIRQQLPSSGGPQIRQALPQVASAGPAPSSSQSVVVDMSALGGGGYAPVSAQISRESQVATIQFGRSSSRLDARDQQLINAVATAQRQNGGNVLVVGHASSRTQQLPKDRYEVANFQVSFARANAVAQALIRAGVSADRVTVEAVSDGQPIYSEAMPTGEAGNRRAEIYFLR
jgi:outer membrane protein OmpA-like peptidoglycan-associated protein